MVNRPVFDNNLAKMVRKFGKNDGDGLTDLTHIANENDRLNFDW